jgi:hypothetical protein
MHIKYENITIGFFAFLIECVDRYKELTMFPLFEENRMTPVCHPVEMDSKEREGVYVRLMEN